MNVEIVSVLGILVMAMILFMSDRISPDVVAMLTVLALLLTHALHTADALAGFGHPAVITIASIFLVTAGLTNTGIAAWMGRKLLKIAGHKEQRMIAVTMAIAAALSLVMNNIASASVLLPGVMSIGRQTKVSASKLLIPLSFGALLGGMATLFTTNNILVNDALRSKGFSPFTLWDFFRIGSILTIGGILFMATLGRRLLPDHGAKEMTPVHRLPGDLAKLYHVPERLFDARILAGSPLDSKTVGQSQLRQDYDFNIVGIIREGRVKLAPSRDEKLFAGDRLLIEGDEDRLHQSGENLGVVIEEGKDVSAMQLADRNIGIVETVLSPYADIVGRSLREIHFREKFGLTVLALRREGQPLLEGVSEMPLRFGDALLVQGPRSRLQLLRSETNFIVLEESDDADGIRRPDKAPWTILGITLMLGLAGFGMLTIATASLLGAMIIVLSGAINIEEGYKAIEWKAVVMVGGMLSMGTAMDKSGAASFISHNILHVIAPFGPVAIMAGFYIVSMLLAQAMSGTAAAILLAPIGVSAGVQIGISPRPLLMTIILGTSSAFLTPVSHSANVLVMGPGGYKFSDYARVGGGLTLLIFVLVVILVPLFWPF